MAAALDFIVPNPLVSRGKPAFRSTLPEPWVAIHVGVGPRRVLVVWSAPGRDYDDVEHAPAEYRIETSADSTNGADGSWRPDVRVTDNAVRSRGHDIEFDGQSWVRLVATAAASNGGVSIDALDVHDASDGTDDTWFFLGDSRLSAFARDPVSRLPGYALSVHAEYPGYFPAVIDGSIGAELATQTLARLRRVLALNPNFRHFALAYGASEAGAASHFRATLQAMIDQLRDAGRVPVLARAPAGGTHLASEYNRAVDELARDNGLVQGPDLDAWCQAYGEPPMAAEPLSSVGGPALQRLWAGAMDPLYAPQ